MVSPLTHTDLLKKLSNFYPDTCTIQQNGPTRDAHGQEIESWSNFAGHVDLNCRIAPSGGREFRRQNQTYLMSTHKIALKGNYPNINEKMRAVVNGVNYDILQVDHDGQDVSTNLLVELVR